MWKSHRGQFIHPQKKNKKRPVHTAASAATRQVDFLSRSQLGNLSPSSCFVFFSFCSACIKPPTARTLRKALWGKSLNKINEASWWRRGEGGRSRRSTNTIKWWMLGGDYRLILLYYVSDLIFNRSRSGCRRAFVLEIRGLWLTFLGRSFYRYKMKYCTFLATCKGLHVPS